MKILHLSDGGLPDWRIEKSALTTLNFGHQPYFAGTKPSNNYGRKIFSKIYEINWSPGGRIGRWLPGATVGNSLYWHIIKKQIQKVLKELRPDIVHAHNLFAAKMMAELKQAPFIYDAHENWSILVRRKKETASFEGLLRLLTEGRIRDAGSAFFAHIRSYLWTRWEREMIESVPVLTPSLTAAAHYRSISDNDKVFVVPNYPVKIEIEDFQTPVRHENLSCVYVGRDKARQGRPHRNIDGFTDLFESHNIGSLHMIGSAAQSTDKVKYHGFLPREALFKEMFRHSVGIIPFQKHWSHSAINPNKAFEYAHAGLFVMCTSSMTELVNTFGENCQTFEDYEQLASRLAYFKDNAEELFKKRIKIFNFARSNLLWDNNEHNIIEAYKVC